MSSTINKLFLKGWVGKEPATRYLPSGDAVTNFPLSTHEGEHTEWHQIYAYKEWSDVAATFAVGDLVWFEGRIRSRTFKTAGYDKPRVIRELVASNLSLVSRKSGDSIPSDNAATPLSSIEGSGQLYEEGASSDGPSINVPSWL
ncbi:single-stranded DNA-binding protein [Cupriavidus basilensis]